MLDRLLGIDKKKFPCDLCGKKVMHMKNHMKKMHGEGKPGHAVECGQCDKTVLLADMMNHVLHYHIRLEMSPSPDSDEIEVANNNSAENSNKKRKMSQDSSSQSAALALPSECSKKSKLTNSNTQSVDAYKNLELEPADDTPEYQVVKETDCYNANYLEPIQNKSKYGSNNVQEIKVDFSKKPSFLFDDSDGQDDTDSDVSIVENIPSVNNRSLLDDELELDLNQISPSKVRLSLGAIEAGSIESTKTASEKVQFVVKSSEKSPDGQKMKCTIILRSLKTVGQAKSSYIKKLGLDKERRGELQFIVNGRKLEDSEQVGQLNNRTVMAEGLWFMLKV